MADRVFDSSDLAGWNKSEAERRSKKKRRKKSKFLRKEGQSATLDTGAYGVNVKNGATFEMTNKGAPDALTHHRPKRPDRVNDEG